MFNKKHKKLGACLVALLSFMFLTAAAFGQGTSASLSGTVQDVSGGVLTGATIIARNVDTGVETRTTSNNAGVYTFPSLQIGTYSIVAEVSGFSRAVVNDVRLGLGSQTRLNLNMAVAGTVTEVEVTGTTESVILEAGSSTGTVLQEETLTSIPLLSNNVMELINMMGGVTPATDPVFGAANQTFAGVAANQINVTRDGMSVNEVRYDTGINASTNINTEMVGEFRMVLSPVDAEMGRGAGQVQMTTRSGSNAFHGSVVWNNQNTALDAQDFSRKLSGNPANWRNLNSYQVTASGPIFRNKTFFFATWEQQFSRSKATTSPTVLTPCARVGIYRYLEGWNPAAASERNTYTAATNTRPSVDMQGNIRYGGEFINSTTLQVQSFPDVPLRYESVFGVLTPAAKALLDGSGKGDPTSVHGDCSAYATVFHNGDISGVNKNFQISAPWDTGTFGVGQGSAGSGGAYRNAYDPTGFISRFTYGVDYGGGRVEMPPVKSWDTGDGLNVAGHRWTRSLIGEGGSIWGTGGDPDRKSLTFKVDHNINNEHRLSGTYTHENFYVDDAYILWPSEYGGYGGGITRRPRTFLVSLTSTLRPTLLNEFRLGLSQTTSWTNSTMDNSQGIKDVLEALMPQDKTNGRLALIGAGEGISMFHTDTFDTGQVVSHPYGSRGNVPTTWGGREPRWTLADTVTWMKGSHSFKGGIEYRRQSSNAEYSGSQSFSYASGLVGTYSRNPVIGGGVTTGTGERRRGMLGQNASTLAGDSWVGLPTNAQDTGVAAPAGAVYTTPYAMMTYFSGSIRNTSQYFYFVPDPSAPNGARWNDVTQGEEMYAFSVRNQEFSLFFKDDWKINNNLTLNLGVRYEFYGVPYAADGRTLGVRGGTSNVFGISPQADLNNWMSNRTITGEYAYVNGWSDPIPYEPVTVYEFIGPGSPNPGKSVFNKDLNNFAPHLGFALQLPWFGRGQTTLRGGWSVSYSQINTFDGYSTQIVNNAVATPSRAENLTGEGDRGTPGTTAYYMDLTDLNWLLPVVPGGRITPEEQKIRPLSPKPVGYFQSTATMIDENIVNPHTHSLNMSLTRNIGRSLSVDVRYIGTLGRNQLQTLNLNQQDYIQNGFYRELDLVRRGGSSEVINSLIPAGSYISGQTGSEQLRNTAGGTASNLAQGNFSGVVSTLATSNGLLGSATGEAGRLFRHGCLPAQRRLGHYNDPTDASNVCEQHTPLNYFYTNPQFNSTGMSYNVSKSNYHSMQTQVTMRPTHGLNFQATWTWSRALSNSGWTNYLGDRNYLLTGQHRSHTLNTYGTYTLPFGPSGYLFRDASGVFKKAIEGWQLNWITGMSTGAPMSITAATNTEWSNNWPILVRSDLWDDKAGKISTTWSDDGTFLGGRYWGNNFTRVVDRSKCNTTMVAGDAYTAGTLYHQYCEYLDTVPNSPTNGQVIPRASAPRALALADGSGQIDPVTNMLRAAKYGTGESYTDEYGFTYREGDDVVVFRNPDQGDGINARGNYANNRITAQGRFTFDLAMSKSIEFMEGKRFEIRVDAQNILNHPTPSGGTPSASNGGRFMSIANPANTGIGGTAIFGNVPNKGGHRTFQARLRLSF